jgi:hypothetical protein
MATGGGAGSGAGAGGEAMTTGTAEGRAGVPGGDVTGAQSHTGMLDTEDAADAEEDDVEHATVAGITGAGGDEGGDA